MSSLPIKLLLFTSSYAPLAVVFFFLYLADHPQIAWICLSIGVLGLGAMIAHFEYIARRQSPFLATIQSAQRHDGDALTYIATYLIPFVTVPFSTQWQESAALLVFIGILALVYISSDMIHINPMLVALQYHVYEVTLAGNKSSYYVLGRGKISPDQAMHLVNIGDGMFLRVSPRRRQHEFGE